MNLLDRRLETLASRLERHTVNLAEAQRSEFRLVEDRVRLDAAVASEHLLAMERLSAGASDRSSAPGTVLALAMPGETLVVPDGHTPVSTRAYSPNADRTWSRVEHMGEDTLRIATLAKGD